MDKLKEKLNYYKDKGGCVLNADEVKMILNVFEKKNKMIDLMASSIDNYDSQLEINYFKDKEDIKRKFEERCK